MPRKRILTGDNTTGKLHVGHYVGSLENRAKMQDEYDTFIILADMHALAYPGYVEQASKVGNYTVDVAIGNLAAGIDPNKSTFFVESGIPEIYELATILSMLTSHNRVLRNPTIKDEIREKDLGDTYSVGFIFFPVIMAADILSVNASVVPVGEDQMPHIELTRELARKFNSLYGEVFVEPEGVVGRVARLPGTDGNTKMTKSLNNTIYLNESEETLKEKIKNMYTDPKRIRATDPGTVEGNPVFVYHDAFNSNKGEVDDLKERYRQGTVGDVEVKEKLFLALNQFLEPIRERYAYYENNPQEVHDIIMTGTNRTREEVKKTLELAKQKMQLL